MRRILAAATCLTIMLMIATAFADQTVPPPNPPAEQTQSADPSFSIRNGICWNMDMHQVQTLEASAMTERISGEWSVMMTDEKVTVSRFSADLIYMFFQDRLRMITYDFFASGGTTVQYRYLTGALCSVYGECRETEGTEIKALMDMINPGLYQSGKIRQGYSWTAKDGTGIFLYYYDTERFAIMYVSPEMMIHGNTAYDVQGL